MNTNTDNGPLTGIRVLDLTSVIAGPVAMTTLADQGADVIKIEPPGGDILRARSPQGMTAGFASSNRGKRSLVLDLKRPEAADIMWQLIEQADVLAQNFRPGTIERLGFGPELALQRNPKLIFLSISGVGKRGPYSDKRVYDPVIQSLSGLADVQADTTTGRPRMVRTLIADQTTAIYAAQAVTSALFARAQTGKGQHVQVAMLDVMMSYLWPEAMAPFSVVDEDTRSAPASAHDMIFPTSDGHITLGAISNKEWAGVCAALNKPEWVDDERFSTPAARSDNRQLRLELVEKELAGHSTAQILTKLQAADVPSAPVLQRYDVLSHPQIEANEIISTIEQPALGTLRQARPAALFEQTPAREPRPAPLLGEHSRVVLDELGIEASTIDTLIRNGTVNQHDTRRASK